MDVMVESLIFFFKLYSSIGGKQTCTLRCLVGGSFFNC